MGDQFNTLDTRYTFSNFRIVATVLIDYPINPIWKNWSEAGKAQQWRGDGEEKGVVRKWCVLGGKVTEGVGGRRGVAGERECQLKCQFKAEVSGLETQ